MNSFHSFKKYSFLLKARLGCIKAFITCSIFENLLFGNDHYLTRRNLEIVLFYAQHKHFRLDDLRMRSKQEFSNCCNDHSSTLFLIALDPNLSNSLQANAQINNTDNIISCNITSVMANKVISEQPVVLRRIISSEDFNNVTLKTGRSRWCGDTA